MDKDLEEIKKELNLTDEEIKEIIFYWAFKFFYKMSSFIEQLKTAQQKLDG